MFNDDGLGQAMEAAYNRDKAEQANKRLDDLEKYIANMSRLLHLLDIDLKNANARIEALETAMRN